MPFAIDDQQLIVGSLTIEDALNLPADDTITAATWTAVDSTDDGTDVTVVAGDASSGTSDGNLNTVTVQASGTGLGAVSITGEITTASGASLLFTDTGTVNGGAAASVGVAWGTAAPIPAPANPEG
jgi:hypothetical protein